MAAVLNLKFCLNSWEVCVRLEHCHPGDTSDVNYPIEFLISLELSEVPPHTLKLNVSEPIVFSEILIPSKFAFV